MKQKYDCEQIAYLISNDNKRNKRIDDIIQSHLNECPSCRQRYNKNDSSKDKLSLELSGTKQNRMFQIILFFITLVLMLIYCLPWFGYAGVSEVNGLIVLRHPIAIFGIMIFIFSIWYPFRHKFVRLIVGSGGLISLLTFTTLEFLSIGTSTTGIDAKYFSYDILNLNNISLSRSLVYALPGFYLGSILLLLTLGLFIAFSIKMDDLNLQ